MVQNGMVFVFIIGILLCTERQARRESVGGLGFGGKVPDAGIRFCDIRRFVKDHSGFEVG